eukprot:30814-Pelagococcus_subviridis.AAC.2
MTPSTWISSSSVLLPGAFLMNRCVWIGTYGPMPASRISFRSSAFTFRRLWFSAFTSSPFFLASFPPTTEPTNPTAWPKMSAETRYLWSTSIPAKDTVKSS